MSSVDRVLAAVLGGLLLPCCGACSQPWQFARDDHPIPGAQAAGTWSSAPQETAAVSDRPQSTGTRFDTAPQMPVQWEQSQLSASSFGSFSGVPHEFAAGSPEPGPTFQPPQGPVFDPVVPVSPD
ncbi:MAG: hypothetical protein ACYSWU_13580, partial [Planctomycetota bacterium]